MSHLRRLVAVSFAVAMCAGGIAPAAQGFTKEQFRYGKETMRLTADAFAQRKADFVGHGCWVGEAGCNKPFPYNQFDWSDDSCSWTPPYLRERFHIACIQHDFGYRNFGKGLTLARTENARAWIDNRFKAEMYRICGKLFQGRARRVCKSEAYSMWGVVRNFNDWRD